MMDIESDEECMPSTSTGRRCIPRRIIPDYDQEEMVSSPSRSSFSIESESEAAGSDMILTIDLNSPFLGLSERLLTRIMGNDTLLGAAAEDDEEENKGLSEHVIKKILTQEAKNNTNQSCSICFNNYKEGEKVKTLPCDHDFHDGCILPWFETNSTCPLCRLDLMRHFESC